jgi:hypothetical protein
MKRALRLSLAILMLSVIFVPSVSRSQEAATKEGDGRPGAGFYVGSVLLSILYVPVKLVTCVGTQAGAAVAYTGTYGVPGNYDGDTNGRDIGEVARRSCTGSWIIKPEQVKKDYGE